MRNKIVIIIVSLVFVGCSKTTIFVLEDNNQNKYSLSDSVKAAFKKDLITKMPLVAIDGIVWKYDKTADTVFLPLKKKEILAIQIIGKNASKVIYGPEAVNGAIIINTINLK